MSLHAQEGGIGALGYFVVYDAGKPLTMTHLKQTIVLRLKQRDEASLKNCISLLIAIAQGGGYQTQSYE
jgi:hypothetical protein